MEAHYTDSDPKVCPQKMRNRMDVSSKIMTFVPHNITTLTLYFKKEILLCVPNNLLYITAYFRCLIKHKWVSKEPANIKCSVEESNNTK